MRRLNRIHLAALALVLIVGIAAAFVMGLMKPRWKSIKELEANIATEEAKAAERPAAEAKLKEAQTDRAASQAKWESIMDTYMSHISLSDPHQAMFEINAEAPTYAPQMIAAIDSNPDVRFTGSLGFTGVGWKPPGPEVGQRVFPQGGFRLRVKDFNALQEWLKNTAKLPRVIALGNRISISGPSPGLEVTIPATIYIYYRDAGQAVVAVAPGAARAAAPASARAGGGRPGSRRMFGPGGGG